MSIYDCPTKSGWHIERREAHSGRHTAFIMDNCEGWRIANLPYTDRTAQVQLVNAARICAGWDAIEACRGATFPDVSRLQWLAALIHEYEELRRQAERADDYVDEDPDATSTMLSEVRGLLAGLEGAMTKATNGGEHESC